MGIAVPLRWLALGAVLIGLAGCAETNLALHAAKQMSATKPVYKVGEPYQINGVWYYPAEDYGYDQTGIAGVYSRPPGRSVTSNGETFDSGTLMAAHRTLPMPSLVRVTNLENGRSIVVRINDRGPSEPGRLIGLSTRAAELLGVPGQGGAKVRVTILADESRAVAAALQAVPSTATQQGVSPDGSPAPMAAPRAVIKVDGGVKPTSSAAERPKFDPAATVPGKIASDGRFLPDPVVTQTPVRSGGMLYVQAGSFSVYDNANKLRARLSAFGPSRVDSIQVGNTQFFRVRLGPIDTVERADGLLSQVLAAGISGAQVVVD